MMVKATKPKLVKSRALRGLGYGLGLWTTGLAVAQMVGFEDFTEAIQGYQLFGFRASLTVAIVVLGIEVFSVPFWFRLMLSPAARLVSSWLALLAPIVWLALFAGSLLLGATPQSGLLGGFGSLPIGAAVVAVVAIWAVTAAWAVRRLGELRIG